MINLSNLIKHAFAADFPFNNYNYSSRQLPRSVRTTPTAPFRDPVRSIFQWQIRDFSCRLQRGSFDFVGTGLVEGPDLKTAFANAGFDYQFVFTGVVPVVDGYMSFASIRAPIQIRATVAPGGALPDYGKLDEELGPFVTMAILHSSALDAEADWP